MLERHLRGVPLECGPTGGGGAPTEIETRAVRPHSSPSIDVLPLLNALRGALKKKEPERYFLYRVARPQGVTHVVRTERIPESWLYSTPGTTFELIETFADMKSATRALRRLERGFDAPVPKASASPPPPWVTAQPCPPR
jgi:hypothetical protein